MAVNKLSTDKLHYVLTYLHYLRPLHMFLLSQPEEGA